MKSSVETYTPEQAKAELEVQEKHIEKGNYGQRKLNPDTVRRYANDMRHGHWAVNNQGLGFDEDGFLKDGRHRLWAVVRAGVSVDFLVCRGLPRQNGSGFNIQDTIDLGRPRTVANQLQIDGIKDSNTMSACARVAAMICTTYDRRVGLIPTREILDLLGTHFRKVMEGFHHNPRITRGFLMAPLALYRAANREKADQFIEDYFTGQNLTSGHPALALKTYFLNRGGIKGRDQHYNAIRAVCLCLWHFERDEKVKSLRTGSDLGIDWLRDFSKGNAKRIKAIMGEDLPEQEAVERAIETN